MFDSDFGPPFFPNLLADLSTPPQTGCQWRVSGPFALSAQHQFAAGDGTSVKVSPTRSAPLVRPSMLVQKLTGEADCLLQLAVHKRLQRLLC